MGSPSHAALLSLYDVEQRRNPQFPGLRREATEHMVRFVDETEAQRPNFVLYSRLSERDADRVIEQQITHFAALGRSFEWKVYGHDTPADLVHRLEAHGFEVGEPEAIMVLDLQRAPEALRRAVDADVQRLDDPTALQDLVSVEDAVWAGDSGARAARLAVQMRRAPHLVSVYVARIDGDPACSGRIEFSPGSAFASLWGGCTRPDRRRRGLYTALVAVRVQEALSRGFRYLTIDASPMSRSIVARHGFRLLTMSWPCTWTPPRSP